MKLNRTVKARLSKSKEVWIFLIACTGTIAVGTFGCLLLRDDWLRLMPLALAGVVAHAAIISEVAGGHFQSFLADKTRGLLLRTKGQVILGVFCGVLDFALTALFFFLLLPRIEASGSVVLLLVFAGFFLPPYLAPIAVHFGALRLIRPK